MTAEQRWVITTSGSRPLDDIVKDVAKKGFAVDEVLDAIGCVIGVATDKVAEAVRAVPGVADVSPEPPPINIGPPDAPVS